MWFPNKEFEGEDVYIIGGGASLIDFNFEKLADKNTIGCNSAFRLGSRICNICFFTDPPWFETFYKELSEFDGQVITHHPEFLKESNREDWLDVMDRDKKHALSKTKLGYGNNSGCSVINLALLMGAKRVFLLGYDCKLGPNGESNWHNYTIQETAPTLYAKFLQGFKQLSEELPVVFPGKEVINLNPDSAIPYFPFNTFGKTA